MHRPSTEYLSTVKQSNGPRIICRIFISLKKHYLLNYFLRKYFFKQHRQSKGRGWLSYNRFHTKYIIYMKHLQNKIPRSDCKSIFKKAGRAVRSTHTLSLSLPVSSSKRWQRATSYCGIIQYAHHMLTFPESSSRLVSLDPDDNGDDGGAPGSEGYISSPSCAFINSSLLISFQIRRRHDLSDRRPRR